MKFSYLRFAIACASAYAIATPVHAQFDQLNKALGGLSKQMEKDKSKKAPASDPSTAASNVASPPTQQESSSSTSQDANFCFDRKKTECFNGSKVAYQGKFDIMGTRLGKVSIADLHKQIAERRCTVVSSPESKKDWQEYAADGNFTLDRSLDLDNVKTYTVECWDRENGKPATGYQYIYLGDSNFPEYFALALIRVRTLWDGTKSFSREMPLIKALIEKFGEPSTLTSTVAGWQGEKGEAVVVMPESNNRNEIVVKILNGSYLTLFHRDAYSRISDAHKRNAPTTAVPKL